MGGQGGSLLSNPIESAWEAQHRVDQEEAAGTVLPGRAAAMGKGNAWHWYERAQKNLGLLGGVQSDSLPKSPPNSGKIKLVEGQNRLAAKKSSLICPPGKDLAQVLREKVVADALFFLHNFNDTFLPELFTF